MVRFIIFPSGDLFRELSIAQYFHSGFIVCGEMLSYVCE